MKEIQKINKKYLLLFFVLICLSFLSSCNGVSSNLPVINSFTANPPTITSGDSSTLSWSITDATSATIDQGVGSVAATTGTTSVSPTITTTYTLTATNAAGSVTVQTTVIVTSALTVTYHGNGNTGGTVPVDLSSPYEDGETVTVLGNTGDLVRINDGGTSYRFTGWNTKADGSGASQAEGSTFTMGKSPVTFYAQWTPYMLLDIGPAGGYIFYDKGIYSNGWRYIEAAPAFTEWTDLQWGSYGTWIGGTETNIGTGHSNTNTIVEWLDVHAETGRAAQLCDDLIVDDYSNWFLPSIDELNLMYTNLKIYGVGSFVDHYYWSSSESYNIAAYGQNFTNGNQNMTAGKSTPERVRAARYF